MRDQPEDKIKFLEILEKLGTIQAACDASGLPRPTFYNWKTKDKEFGKAVEKALRRGGEEITDLAESIVVKSIKAGNLGSAKFWLKNRHIKFKTQREQNSIERDFKNKQNRFQTPTLGEDDIEY